MNGFEEEGARALETMVTENHTLLELDVSFCRIPVSGAPFLAAGLQNNDNLERVNVCTLCLHIEYQILLIIVTGWHNDTCVDILVKALH